MTFGDADSASLQEEVPGLGFLPSRAGFRIAKVFSTDRCLPGVVTALSLLRGGRSLPEAFTTSILARRVSAAGACPLHARAVVILFNPEAHNAAGAQPKYLLQFTKRRMRTFITIPSARNINSTDDPP